MSAPFAAERKIVAFVLACLIAYAIGHFAALALYRPGMYEAVPQENLSE